MPTDASAGLRADAPSFVPAAAELLSADDIEGARDRDEHDASVGVSDRDEHGESVDVSDRDEHDASVDVSERDEHDASVEVSEGVSAGGSDGEALQHADVGEVQHADADSADDDADDDEPEDSDDEALQLARALSLSQADYVEVTTPRTRWTATRTRRAAYAAGGDAHVVGGDAHAVGSDAHAADGDARAADSDDSSAPAPDLRPGQRAIIVGLQSPAGRLLNGRCAVLTAYDAARGRWQAEVGGVVKLCRAANLYPADALEHADFCTGEVLLDPAFPRDGAPLLAAFFAELGCAVAGVWDVEERDDGLLGAEVQFATPGALALAMDRGEAAPDGWAAHLLSGHRLLLRRWVAALAAEMGF